MAEKKGVKSPHALAKLAGFNYANAYKMWHSRQKMISVDTINTLCDALKCRPGDLFRHLPGEPQPQEGKKKQAAGSQRSDRKRK
ncbi:MAG: helix-turn-helix domain-containing protein [Blastocatellia bacterium]